MISTKLEEYCNKREQKKKKQRKKRLARNPGNASSIVVFWY
jgi:hypothetical protein